MKALVKEGRTVRLLDLPSPEIQRPDDVIVELICAGVCRTDLHVASGAIASAEPITLGHELCGRVIARGPQATVAIGDLVTADPRIGGGFLGIDRHGVFAERMRLPSSCLWTLPAGVDPRAGAYVEPIAAALGVVTVSGERWVIGGDNRFSALVRLVVAAERRRACDVLDGQASSYDIAVETSGTEREIDGLIDALRPGGVLVVRSRNPGRVSLPLDRIVAKQLTLVGVQYGAFERAVGLLGDLELGPLLGDSYPLARFEDAFAAASASEARKVFLTCAA